ncbi:MAG: LysR family transcriptional regulator [Pseudomonadota bacterium]
MQPLVTQHFVAYMQRWCYKRVMKWDDLQALQALGETRSVRGAAQRLGVNPSTVTRKLEALESDLGVVLFTRSPKGLNPTQEMLSIQASIGEVELKIADIRNHLRGFNQRLEGRIRFAVPDALALEFLLAEFANFCALYPQVDLEIVPGYQNLDLAQGEVDVAIRATDFPPESMVGRPLSRVGLAAYATTEFLQQFQLHETTGIGPVAIDQLPWVDWALAGEVSGWYQRLQQEYFPNAHVHIRCDHVHMHSVLIEGGMGAGILPCFVGDQNPRLVRLQSMPVQSGPMLWLLSHPDLRAARRVHVFLEFVAQAISAHRSQLLGAVDTEPDLPGAS